MSNKYIKILIVLFLMFVVPAVTNAALFKVGESYSLRKGENLSEDIYIAGGSAAVAGDVDGDLFVAGGNVFVGNEVSRDSFVVGGTVNVIGDIGGNLRVAGGNIVFSGSVGRDFIAAGGDIKILKNSIVSGNTSLVGGNIVINGVVNGDLKIAGGYVEINNHVRGNVSVTADTVVVTDDAVIDGNLNYSSARQATISEKAIINGDVFFKEIQVKPLRERLLPTVWGTWTIVKFIILLVAALIMNSLLRSISGMFVSQAVNHFWKNVLRGFVFLFAVPLAFVLVAMTFVGAPFLIIGVSAWILLGMTGWIFGPIILGALVSKVTQKDKDVIEISWKTILIGVFLYVLVGYIPFIGFTFKFIILLVSLGSIYKVLYDKFVSAR